MKYCFVIISLFINSFAFAGTAKLQEFTSKDFKVTKSYTDSEMNKKLTEFFALYEEVVESFVKSQKAPEAADIKIFVDTALMSFEGDPSLSAAELFYPLYEQYKKDFDKYINTLNKGPQKDIKEALKDIAREMQDGNG